MTIYTLEVGHQIAGEQCPICQMSLKVGQRVADFDVPLELDDSRPGLAERITLHSLCARVVYAVGAAAARGDRIGYRPSLQTE